MREVELVLDTMGVDGDQRVMLATFLFHGEARHWCNAFRRLEGTPIIGVEPHVPRAVSWERFVQGFNDHYYPESFRYDQIAAFTNLNQGGMSMADNEAKFAELSKYAPEMVLTDGLRCSRFDMGMIPEMFTSLLQYKERNYSDLVDMAKIMWTDY